MNHDFLLNALSQDLPILNEYGLTVGKQHDLQVLSSLCHADKTSPASGPYSLKSLGPAQHCTRNVM
jgi:hypothetical protein